MWWNAEMVRYLSELTLGGKNKIWLVVEPGVSGDLGWNVKRNCL